MVGPDPRRRARRVQLVPDRRRSADRGRGARVVPAAVPSPGRAARGGTRGSSVRWAGPMTAEFTNRLLSKYVAEILRSAIYCAWGEDQINEVEAQQALAE